MSSAFNELSPLAKWVYNRLASDSAARTLVGDRFFEDDLPPGADLAKPAVLFTRQAGRDINGAFGVRMAIKGLYQLKAVCTGNSYMPADPVANCIERLFQGVNQLSDPGTGLVVMGVVRQDLIRYKVNDEGVQYCHTGGLYRIDATFTGTQVQDVVVINIDGGVFV